MYKLEAILEAARKQSTERAKLWRAECDKEIETMAKQSDKDDIQITLMRYYQCEEHARQFYNFDPRPIEEAYHLFDRMSYDLQKELGATVTDDQIFFTWNGKSLGFILQLLADHYHIKPGMFTFESSFTNHEAYTEKYEYRFSMGIVRDHDDTVVIDFDFRPYFDKAELY